MPNPRTSSCRVSVIIPTTGGARLRRCVEALRRAADGIELQIILVVTGGADELPACDDLVRCDPPFIWAKANNAGLRVARYPLVLLLNDDAFFRDEGGLRQMLEVMDQWPYLAVLGPVSNGISRYFQQHTEAPIPGGHFVPTFRPLCGHCLLIRRECFAAVGNFDESFTDYGGDELDWLYRANQTGYRWGIHEGVFVEHSGSATFKDQAENWHAGQARFERKHAVDLHLVHPWPSTGPEVSWVIASHGSPRYLSVTLDSIRACSTGFSYEVVIAVDGGSPLPYQELLHFYPDLPIRMAFFPKSACIAEAKNRAARMAKGRALFYFDDDDIVIGDRRLMLQALKDAEVVHGEFKVRWWDGSFTDFPRAPLSFQGLMQNHSGTILGPQCVAIRRAVADRYYFREDLEICEDYELWLRLTRDGIRVRQLPGTAVAIYLQRANSSSATQDMEACNHRLRHEYSRWYPLGEPVAEPEYSYVITAWNEEARLARCLDSLLECAPMERFEVVLADDGSVDGTLAVAQAYLGRLPLRIHPFEKAPTPGVAYNRALRQARGKFILVMDADDETTIERIAELRAVLDATGADFVYGGWEQVHGDWSDRFFPPTWDVARDMEHPWISPCAAIFRRSILDAGVWLPEEPLAGEDRLWMLDVDAAGFHIVGVPDIRAHRYWQNAGSLVRRQPVDAIVRRYEVAHRGVPPLAWNQGVLT